jgi:hypothetical protein
MEMNKALIKWTWNLMLERKTRKTIDEDLTDICCWIITNHIKDNIIWKIKIKFSKYNLF